MPTNLHGVMEYSQDLDVVCGGGGGPKYKNMTSPATLAGDMKGVDVRANFFQGTYS